MYNYDFWGVRRLRKDLFITDYVVSRVDKISLDDAKKEALDLWNWIQENK